MRILFAVIFILIVIALGICTVFARRSKKAIGSDVARMTASLIPPVIGNLILVISTQQTLSIIGYYIYFIGMDFVMSALLRFTMVYCSLEWKSKLTRNCDYSMFLLDIVQYILNPFLRLSFTVERLDNVYGAPYYRFVPLYGQIFHRVLDYGVLVVIILIFLIKFLRSPRIYSERYYVILFTLLLSAIWQTLYIVSRTPIDRSMIGFGLFGVLIFYFSLYYRPLRLLDRMLANIVSEMPEALFFFDASERCIWVNTPGKQMTKIYGNDYETVPQRLQEMFGKAKRNCYDQTQVIGNDEDARYYNLRERNIRNANGRIIGKLLSIRDITEEQRRFRQELYNATHDRLTGLYTREYLYERIHATLQNDPETPYYVIFVDVKNFKIVNDVFSSDFGDYALRQVADNIRSVVTHNAVFGRLAGDTFGILMPAADFDAKGIEAELTGIVIQRDAIEYHLLIHLGIYPVKDPETEVSVMFDRAHLALSVIRDEYHAHIAFYDDNIREKVLWDQQISAQLAEAIQTWQLRPYLQPIVNTDGKVVGAEALARWIHPEHGFLSPAKFIPVFEKNGMIVEVDKHMWRSACEILARWGEAHPDLFISVNISPKDFYFVDVTEEIRALVREYGIDPVRLRIEITETVMMNDADDRMNVLRELRKDGFIVEMDDFGSGYSSLNMLKDMPVDVLKIDMKFLSKSSNEDRSLLILQNILKLSKDLGIASLTEGVETEEQFRNLADMQCQLFQGYYFAKPLPEKEFEETYFQ